MIVVLADEIGEQDPAGLLCGGLGAAGQPAVVGPLGTTADEVSQALAAIGDDAGAVSAVVLLSAGPAGGGGDLARLSPEQWRQRVEHPLQQTMACFQGAYRSLRVEGGSLVLLVPTLALVGAAGFVPWATVAEGQRSLAKAAARAWGAEGITVNVVAVPGHLLSPPTTGGDRPGQPLPALDTSPQMDGQVAGVVASLLSPAWAGVTGATVAVDAGVWMTP